MVPEGVCRVVGLGDAHCWAGAADTVVTVPGEQVRAREQEQEQEQEQEHWSGSTGADLLKQEQWSRSNGAGAREQKQEQHLQV